MPGERRGGVCPVESIWSRAAPTGSPDRQHYGTRELVVEDRGLGIYLCDKCRALFVPEDEDAG